MSSDDECKSRLARRMKRRSVANYNFTKKSEKNNFKMEDVYVDLDEHDEDEDADGIVVDCEYKSFLENLRVDGGSFVFTHASGIVVRYEADAENSSDPEIIAAGKNPFCGGDRTPFISSKCDSIIDLDSEKSNGSPGSSSDSQYQDFRRKIASVQHDLQCQDFYNFDNDRKPKHFKLGQIWAAQYRANLSHFLYARVDRNSAGAFLLTWLKPNPVSIGEKRWCDAGLPVACGSFDLSPELNSEESWPMVPSHKCSWDHGGTDEEFEIYPREGEIWALYKDWNLDEWVYNPDSVKGCKFQLVEILHFSKYLGSCGACLAKVDGFKSIFERQTTGESFVTLRIPPANLYIFSHNVPAYRFEGGEIDGVVEGMFELDQSALLEIVTQEIDSPKAPLRRASFLEFVSKEATPESPVGSR